MYTCLELCRHIKTQYTIYRGKPSFLLFDIDLHTPTEAALIPPTPPESRNLSDYCQQLIISLFTAHQNVVSSIRKAQQKHFKLSYDRKVIDRPYQVGPSHGGVRTE